MMNIALIMRGVPGSGKSTLAKCLAGSVGVIHSTDDYFCVDGEYRFDPEKLREYHDRNFEAFCRSVCSNVPIVICDNTNTHRWHFERYVIAAQNAGYRVGFVVMPHPDSTVAAQRTLHKVPVGAIQRMIDTWEA